jgi:Arc/MetJ family transcription regulator
MTDYSALSTEALRELKLTADKWMVENAKDRTVKGRQKRAMALSRYEHLDQVLAVREAIMDIEKTKGNTP